MPSTPRGAPGDTLSASQGAADHTSTRASKTAAGRRRPGKVHAVDLALQGGGAHGAFTWGVLDRLLEDERIDLSGVSGTSAGAMNAVIMASGLMQGGRQAAREALRRFWSEVAASAVHASPLNRGLFGAFLGNTIAGWPMLAQYYDLASRMFSPYQLNPLNFNPLREVLERAVDFDAVRRCDRLQLFVAATHVRSGRLRIFRNAELGIDALMASACLPMVFQAVEIDGEAYWDGGYMGNPSLFPLVEATPAHDLLLVQINPSRRDALPTQASEILDRIDEITFHGSLIKELRTIAMLKKLIRDEGRAGHRYREPLFAQIAELRVHRLDGGARLARLGPSSKVNTDWSFLLELHRDGYSVADDWLHGNFAHLGRRSTVDLEREFLSDVATEA